MKATFAILRLMAMLGILILARSVCAQGTAFIYQGRLNSAANPAGGSFDFQFSVFDAVTSGNQIGATITNLATGVTNGLFSVSLDFGSNVFSGPPRWLAVGVRTNGSLGSFTILSPRQSLAAVPYAITAGNLSGALPAAQLSGSINSSQLGGVYTGAVILSNAANRFTGDGSGLTNLQAGNLAGAVPLSGGGTGQTNAAAALTALGGASLKSNNAFAGNQTVSNLILPGVSTSQGAVYNMAGLEWINNGAGASLFSSNDPNFTLWGNVGHGGAGNGTEWQWTFNQLYFGPVTGGHVQFGLSSDTLGDAFVLQFIGPSTSYNRSHALGWHNKSLLGDEFWDAWSDTYNVYTGATLLHFTLPIPGGNQDWHSVGTVNGLILDSDTGVEIPGYLRLGFAVTPATGTNYYLSWTNQEVSEIDLAANLNILETNLDVTNDTGNPHFANSVSLDRDLIIYPGPNNWTLTTPTNWLWESPAGAAFAAAPTTLTNSVIARLHLHYTLGSATNRFASIFYTHYSPGYDTDAAAFIASAGITNATLKTAVNTLVISLKSSNLWSKADCIYPFVGAAAGPDSFNLRNPSAFRITWYGTVSHNTNGVTGDGSTGYGDTGFNAASAPSPNYTTASASIAVYAKTLGSFPCYSTSVIGAVDNAPHRSDIWEYPSATHLDGMNNSVDDFNIPQSAGAQIGTIGSGSQYLYNPSGFLGGAATPTGVPNANFFVLARNNSGPQCPTDGTLGFAWIGGGLSQSDIGALAAIMLQFETTLGRQ